MTFEVWRDTDHHRQWTEICDRLERLGIQPTPDHDARGPHIYFADGRRRFKLIDILDRFIELMERMQDEGRV